MANVKFYLKEKNSIKDTLILLALNYNNQRFKYSTKISISPKHWDSKTFKVKSQVSHSLKLNTQIRKTEDAILEIYHTIKTNGGVINNSVLKERLDIQLNRQEKQDFFSYMSLYIEQKHELQKTTKRDYLQTYNTLKQFENSTGYLVSFESINLDFYHRFKDYMLKSLNHSINTFGKRIKTIKSIMNYATEIGVNNNLEFNKKSFKVLDEKVQHAYLKSEELDRLIELKLSGMLEKTRDTFLLMVYFGMRHSDYLKINRNNITNGVIYFRDDKTKGNLSIPIHPDAMPIIEKWNYILPKISNPQINKHIKTICKLAEINEVITLNGITKEKYKFICSHTARRTLSTIGYLSNVHPRVLKNITGHSSEKTFMTYVQKDREVELKHMLEIFPQNKLKKVV